MNKIKLFYCCIIAMLSSILLSTNLFAKQNYCYVLIDEKFNLTHTSAVLDKNLHKDTTSYWKFTGRKKARFSEKIKGQKKWQRHDSNYNCRHNTIYFSNNESIKIIRYVDNKIVFKKESGKGKYFYLDME